MSSGLKEKKEKYGLLPETSNSLEHYKEVGLMFTVASTPLSKPYLVEGMKMGFEDGFDRAKKYLEWKQKQKVQKLKKELNKSDMKTEELVLAYTIINKVFGVFGENTNNNEVGE